MLVNAPASFTRGKEARALVERSLDHFIKSFSKRELYESLYPMLAALSDHKRP